MYQIYGLTIASDIDLPELTPEADGSPQWTFHVCHEGALSPKDPPKWFHTSARAGDEPWVRAAKHDAGYLLRFTELADFVIGPATRDIRCYAMPDVPQVTIRHLLFDHVMPRVLSRGALVLHASTVVIHGEAVLFLGDTGQGKSTLTAAFCSRGFPLLTDDCLLVRDEQNRPVGVPGYPGLRLWPDVVSVVAASGMPRSPVAHYVDKVRLGTDEAIEFCEKPVPICRAYVLAEDTPSAEGVRITPLDPRARLAELIAHTYRLDITDREALVNELDRLEWLARVLDVSRLSFRRHLSLLPPVRDAVLADLG